MKTDQTSQKQPISRPKLYLFTAAIVPIFMALQTAFVFAAMVYIFRATTQVVCVDAEGAPGQWSKLEPPPGVPDQLEVTPDGSLWTSTRMKHTLSRFRDGRWEVFQGKDFGTRGSTASRDFIVVGDRVWAIIDNCVVEFDGEKWHTHAIPNPVADHVLAASERGTWVLGSDGILRMFDGRNWETAAPDSAVAALQWDSENGIYAPDFLAADDGSLWASPGQILRYQDGNWSEVTFGDQPFGGADLLGYADRKIWIQDPGGVLWIGEDTQTKGGFSNQQLGMAGRESIEGVYQIGEAAYAAGNKGIYLFDGEQCQLKWPVPEDVWRCEAIAAADGKFYTIAVAPIGGAVLWLGALAAAVFSGLGLLAIRLILNPGYSFLKILPRPYVLAIVVLPLLMSIPMVIAGLSGKSLGLMLMFAPLMIGTLFLLAPPLLTLMIFMRERMDGRCEVMRLKQVAGVEIPAAAVGWIEKNTPALETLGFRRIGDYRLKEGNQHFGRFFIHADGKTLAGIDWLKVSILRNIDAFSFFSVTDDLTYLETGSIALPGNGKPFEAPFILQGVPNRSHADTFDAHLRGLEELSDTRNTWPRPLVEDDLEKVVLYGQKLLYDRLKTEAMAMTNPYDDVTFDWGDRTASPQAPATDATDDRSQPSAGLPAFDTVEGWGTPNHVE